MKETYKGHEVTITRIRIPTKTANRRGPDGQGWKVTIDGVDVTKVRGILHSNQPDEASVMASVKKYIDGLPS